MFLISAFGIPAVRAGEAAFLELHRVFLVAVGAFHTFLLGAVLNEFLEGAADTISPRIDALLTEVEAGDDIHDMIHRDAITQKGGGHFGVVPELLVETAVQTAQDHLVTGFVLVNEIVGFGAIVVAIFHDGAVIHPLGQKEALIAGLSSEDFVRLTFVESNVGHPILIVVLEMDDISA